MGFLGFLAVPLGYVMSWIYSLTPNYFVTIFLFTLLTRLLMFPLNIKSQKSTADRARLAPRLERLQKKYANDRQKLAEKQQALYQKEGVSMTGGCLPMIVQMIVLFSVIAVIYKPLTYVQKVPDADIATIKTAIVAELTEDNALTKEDKQNLTNDSAYYRDMQILKHLDTYKAEIRAALVKDGKTPAAADETIAVLENTKKDFSIGKVSMLEQASKDGIKPNWLWVIAILSGVTSLFTSLLSMHFSKASQPKQEAQPGGCSPNFMMYMLPVMSLIISFTVPAGVAVYWIFSNLLALVQTTVLNAMYNPAKIRAQAEAEYAERRRRKAEDKERLKAARLAEQAAWQKEENEKKAAKAGKKPSKKAAQPAEDSMLNGEPVAQAPSADAQEEQ